MLIFLPIFQSSAYEPRQPSKRVWPFLFALLAFFAPSTSFAQTQRSVSYVGAVLTSFSERIDLAGRIYVVPDDSGKYDIGSIKNMINTGELTSYRSQSNRLDLGFDGNKSWVVLPVTSLSKGHNWILSLGGTADGRGTLLSAFTLFDTAKGEYSTAAVRLVYQQKLFLLSLHCVCAIMKLLF